MILNLSSTIATTHERDESLWIEVPPVAGIAELRLHACSELIWDDGTPAPRHALAPGTRLTVIGEDDGGQTLDVQRLMIARPPAGGRAVSTGARVPLRARLRLAIPAWPSRGSRPVSPIALSGTG